MLKDGVRTIWSTASGISENVCSRSVGRRITKSRVGSLKLKITLRRVTTSSQCFFAVSAFSSVIIKRGRGREGESRA
jgi:hypothetical protein